MKERIGVLGCGWLGLGLAQSYVADDFVVHGSRQSKKMRILFKSRGLMALLSKSAKTMFQEIYPSFFMGLAVYF